MIPVPLPDEPAEFDLAVRQEGLAQMHEQGQNPDLPLPVGSSHF